MSSEPGAALVVALTYGLSVAVAGVPVVVLAFVLTSSRPAPVGLGFAGGWALGLVVAVSDVAVAVSNGPDAPSNTVLAWVRIAAGVAVYGEGAGRVLARGDQWLQARGTALSAVVLAVLGGIVLVNGVTAL